MENILKELHGLEKKHEIDHKVNYKKIAEAFTEAKKELTIEAILYALDKLKEEFDILVMRLIVMLKEISDKSLLYHAVIKQVKKMGLPGEGLKKL